MLLADTLYASSGFVSVISIDTATHVWLLGGRTWGVRKSGMTQDNKNGSTAVNLYLYTALLASKQFVVVLARLTEARRRRPQPPDR